MFDSSPQFVTAADVFSYIESFTNLERGGYRPRQYRLERMRRLLSHFGNPHRGFRIIHLAGSKGKGSTAAFAASILESAGYPTGLYTSPHVSDYRERITRAGAFLPDDVYIAEAQRIAAYVDRVSSSDLPVEELPTTFELLTLLAFLCFRTSGYPWVVLETGIGGRLDATNVVLPKAAVITPIELEHTDYLGNTIEEIAAEKAGIIKEGAPTFIGRLSPTARTVVATVAAGRESPVYDLSQEVSVRSSRITSRGTEAIVRWRSGFEIAIRLGVIGRVQIDNACLAATVCRHLVPDISDSALQRALSDTRIAGRMELIDGAPPVVLDGAHTPESVRTSVEAFQQAFGRGGVLVFGAVAGKNIAEMARILAPAFDDIVITTPGTFKESDPTAVAAQFRAHNPHARLIPDAVDALASAAVAGRPILVTGSFYLLGEIRGRSR